jgi:hypothetical protein
MPRPTDASHLSLAPLTPTTISRTTTSHQLQLTNSTGTIDAAAQIDCYYDMEQSRGCQELPREDKSRMSHGAVKELAPTPAHQGTGCRRPPVSKWGWLM